MSLKSWYTHGIYRKKCKVIAIAYSLQEMFLIALTWFCPDIVWDSQAFLLFIDYLSYLFDLTFHFYFFLKIVWGRGKWGIVVFIQRKCNCEIYKYLNGKSLKGEKEVKNPSHNFLLEVMSMGDQPTE